MTTQLTIDFEVAQNYRESDPQTSVFAGKSVSIRAGSQRHTILQSYLTCPTVGLTDEEAGDISGLSQKPKCCYWKRCSELRQMGLITPNGTLRKSSANENQMVCVITPEGRELLSELSIIS